MRILWRIKSILRKGLYLEADLIICNMLKAYERATTSIGHRRQGKDVMPIKVTRMQAEEGIQDNGLESGQRGPWSRTAFGKSLP